MNDFFGLPKFDIWSPEHSCFGQLTSADFAKGLSDFLLDDGQFYQNYPLDQIVFIIYTPYNDSQGRPIKDGDLVQFKDIGDLYKVKWSKINNCWVLDQIVKRSNVKTNIILSNKTNKLLNVIGHVLSNIKD